MKRVIILGGGLAGLSSAVFLTSQKIPVLLLESSNRPGGRVTSFYDPVFKSFIDNGQHIMMGCYLNTLLYLKLISARQNFFFQKNLEVIFFSEEKKYSLVSGRGWYPFGLATGLLKFELLSVKERFDLLKFILLLPLSSRRDISNIDAGRWLRDSGQGERIINTFWNTFIIGALNSTPDKASALLLRRVLLQVFFTGNKSSTIIIPDKPLTEAFCIPAVHYLEQNKSEVSLSERVIRLETDRGNKKVTKIVTNKRVITDFSKIIAALPYHSLEKIIHLDELKDLHPAYSSILTVHFRMKMELFNERFIALVNSPIHWIFKQPDHYTIVISSADEYIQMDNKSIQQLICAELVKQFKVSEEDFSSYRIIKEKRATFIPSVVFDNKRPGNISSCGNLLIAGDWTNTGLPATIEGAVTSGLNAVTEIIN